MPWKTWADFAYQHKLRIKDWPLSARPPAAGFDIHTSKNGISHADIENTVQQMKRVAGNLPARTPYINIVQWSPGMILPYPFVALRPQIMNDMQRKKH
jgi:hypothetical protein